MKKLSTSILSIKENIKENVQQLAKFNTDYIHLDIMDGKFVSNKTWDIESIKEIIKDINKPLDVHLMVSDIKKYIDDFSTLKPEYITFHLEATSDASNVINYIKSKGIKAGISINPNTNVEDLIAYLKSIDLVLIMSVEPGKGGQEYLRSANDKIDELELLRNAYKYNYVIEVDGGITDQTIEECLNADIFVVGSYITNGNYKEQIDIIRRKI